MIGRLSKSVLVVVCFAALLIPNVFAQTLDGSDLFVVIVNNKRGYIDRAGNVVIKPKWGGANVFSEGLAVVASYEGGYNEGYIDTSGKVVIKPQYQMARDFTEGLAAVGFGRFELHNGGEHKTGFIDKTGKLVIEPRYRDAMSFSEGLAAVYDSGKYGYLDRSGKLIIPLQFDDALSFSEGLACVKVKGKYGFIDKSGRIVIRPKFTLPSSFSEGLANVVQGGKASPFYGGFAIRDSGRPIFIDKSGKVVLKFGSEVVSAKGFSEGLAAIEIRKDLDTILTAFINKKGNYVIPPKYNDVDSFQDGLAQFLLNGKWTFMDKTGKVVFSTNYQISYGFERGLAFIQEGGLGFDELQNAKYGYIDKTGKVVWEPTK